MGTCEETSFKLDKLVQFFGEIQDGELITDSCLYNLRPKVIVYYGFFAKKLYKLIQFSKGFLTCSHGNFWKKFLGM